MSKDRNARRSGETVDYSAVTPATGTNPDDKPIADTLANSMPTADSPADSMSMRTDPDKTIPGGEAAAGLDDAEEKTTDASVRDKNRN